MDINSLLLILQHAEKLGDSWVSYALVAVTVGLCGYNMWQRSRDVDSQKQALQGTVDTITDARDHVAKELLRTRDILTLCQNEQASLNERIVTLQSDLTACNQKVFELQNNRQ